MFYVEAGFGWKSVELRFKQARETGGEQQQDGQQGFHGEPPIGAIIGKFEFRIPGF
jgi:hypothetical protein